MNHLVVNVEEYPNETIRYCQKTCTSCIEEAYKADDDTCINCSAETSRWYLDKLICQTGFGQTAQEIIPI